MKNIDTVSSTINIIKGNKFVRLARRAIESTVKQIERRTKISGCVRVAARTEHRIFDGFFFSEGVYKLKRVEWGDLKEKNLALTRKNQKLGVEIVFRIT